MNSSPKKIALIAGGGELPIEFLRSAKEQGVKTVVLAIVGMAGKNIEEFADKTYWLKVDQYAKFVFFIN